MERPSLSDWLWFVAIGAAWFGSWALFLVWEPLVIIPIAVVVLVSLRSLGSHLRTRRK